MYFRCLFLLLLFFFFDWHDHIFWHATQYFKYVNRPSIFGWFFSVLHLKLFILWTSFFRRVHFSGFNINCYAIKVILKAFSMSNKYQLLWLWLCLWFTMWYVFFFFFRVNRKKRLPQFAYRIEKIKIEMKTFSIRF